MKKVGVAIQLNHTREEELHTFKASLQSIGVEPIFYGLIPFSDEVTGAEPFADYDQVIAYGSTKLIRLWQKGVMPKGTTLFYHEPSFDQFNYTRLIPKKLLLNGDAMFTTLGRIKDTSFGRQVFIKPTRDLKAFAGLFVEKGRTPAEVIFSFPQDSSLTDDETVLVAPMQHIVKEFRCFVVDGKIIDTSIYKVGSKVIYVVPTEHERQMVADFFKEVSAHYEPHHAYVVDFALLESGKMVLIEYNCLNCSGMYTVDKSKVFSALIEHVSK